MDLVKKEASELTVQENQELWGNDQLSSSDFVIPRALVMQGLSEFVVDGKAKLGDVVNSLTEEVMGSIQKPMEFIPFWVDKKMKVLKEVNGKFVLDRIEALTPVNEHLYDGVENGFKVKYEAVYNVYAIVPGSALPIMVSFKSTSKKAGKKIATIMYAENMTALKLPPCATKLKLISTKRQNDKGTFAVVDIARVGQSTKEEINECAKWIGIVKSGAAKSHEVEEHEDQSSSQPSGSRELNPDMEF